MSCARMVTMLQQTISRVAISLVCCWLNSRQVGTATCGRIRPVLMEFVMEHGVFRAWLAEVDDLTDDQRRELEEVLAGRPSRAAVTAVIETSPGDERRCPHCGHGASVGCGQADGLRRFRCKGCGRSFNALTGTPLARLRKKECWLDFGQSLSEGETVVASAERCGGQHRLSLAPPLSHRPGGRSDPDRHCRGRRNLRAAQL